LTDHVVENSVERGRKSRAFWRSTLLATYLLAAIVGYALGATWKAEAAQPLGSPLARVGYALRAQNPQATPEEWALLQADLNAVRATWKPEERDVFDLVVALRGLEHRGRPDYQAAQRLCAGLAWPRCDRTALEALRERSRP
jgi:hypothetical protein